MSEAAIWILNLVLAGLVLAVWDLGRRWVAARDARALHERIDAFEQRNREENAETRARCDVNKRAIENLAKEADERMASLTAQQVGVITKLQESGQRTRQFK